MTPSNALLLYSAKEQAENRVRESGEGVNYEVSADFHPMRLSLDDKRGADLVVEVENVSGGSLLTSLEVALPKGLGFDATGIRGVSDKKEVRVGELAPGNSKAVVLRVFVNCKAAAGEHDVEIKVRGHYRDYEHVQCEESTRATLRVVTV